MQLRIWGARGSIPVSGPQYLRYGGDTTCAELRTEADEVVVLDAGTGARALGAKLMEEGRTEIHFLLSHAHWDHLLGFPFFRPLYAKGVTLRFHGCTYAQESLRTLLAETMRPPFFPVRLDDVQATLVFDEECRPAFEVGSLRCETIPLSHPNHGYGFRLYEGARSFAFFPDNEPLFPHPKGRSFDEYAEFLRGVDLLLHDAEYRQGEYDAFSRGWGHSVWSDTVRLTHAAQAKRLLLWHLNQDRSDDDLDAILVRARQAAEDEGAGLDCQMASTGLELDV